MRHRMAYVSVLRSIVVIVFMLSCVGCATSGYLVDRKRDAMDMVTCTVGTGLGASARVGPLHCGLLFGRDRVGIRGGEVKGRWGRTDDLWAGLIDPLLMLPGGEGVCFYEDVFLGEEKSAENPLEISRTRGKRYFGNGVCPFIVLPQQAELPGRRNPYEGYLNQQQYPWHYLTAIEVSVGVGGTLRLGVNPGEMVDFLLGWFGIDIFSDDLSRRRSEGERTGTGNLN